MLSPRGASEFGGAASVEAGSESESDLVCVEGGAAAAPAAVGEVGVGDEGSMGAMKGWDRVGDVQEG